MREFPKSLRLFSVQALHVAAITMFYLLFLMLYEPKALTELMSTGQGQLSIRDMYSFNISISIAIWFVSLSITRSLLFAFRKKLTESMVIYALWCVFEVTVGSAFVALYLALISPSTGNYFFFLGRCISCYVGAAVFAYAILTLIYMVRDGGRSELPGEGARLKFYDNRHLLKFVTNAAAVMYIEAQENYYVIHYAENGIMKSVQIRNSMKSLEPLSESAGFVKVHRSYIVNPQHITQLRKDKEGMYFADLDAGGEIAIPVSKKYHEQVASAL